jgi:hypothetical protein
MHLGSQKASGSETSSYPLIYTSMEEQQYHDADFEQISVDISAEKTISCYVFHSSALK